MTLKDKRADLLAEYKSTLEPLPPRAPIDMRIISKRKTVNCDEWRIDYTGEGKESMPEAALRRIPAYLLIPSPEKFSPPYPAMICFHQCNCDCWIGKEAVVGKEIERKDQAYGSELMHQGFVVLAPDHPLCGERSVPGVREAGEQIVSGCVPPLLRHLGRDGSDLNRGAAFEGSRAVELLLSLNFVDRTRIGAIGHSMGAGDTITTMLGDDRIRAGIVSGPLLGERHRFLPLICPRLFVMLRGALDTSITNEDPSHEDFSDVRRHYQEEGGPDRFVVRRPVCGHHFLNQFKWEAYRRLKDYFGMSPRKRPMELSALLADARKENQRRIGPGQQFPEIQYETRELTVLADNRLRGALCGILGNLIEKTPGAAGPAVSVSLQRNHPTILCIARGAEEKTRLPYNDVPEDVSHEHAATLTREEAQGELRYSISFAGQYGEPGRTANNAIDSDKK